MSCSGTTAWRISSKRTRNYAIIAPLSLLVGRPHLEFRLCLPFCILNVLGDVLADGELRFVEAARTLEAARRRIKALAKLWPGQYVIYK
jgi:hypothetical protein